MGKIIGIDLGTTNSCVSVMVGNEPTVIANDEGARTTPSVVAFLDNGERKIGAPAKRQAITNPTRTVASIKRFMGMRHSESTSEINRVPYKVVKGDNDTVRVDIDGRLYTSQEISAMTLQKMKKVAEDYLGEPVTEAVITVPAYFNDSQRQATKEAGAIAGLEVKRILNEPTAAALAYGLDKRHQEMKIAVYDLGGGTFDISILELGGGVFEVISTNGDTHLGGDDFDQIIIEWLADEFKRQENIDLRKDPMALQRLKEAAEKAKVELSGGMETEINLPYITAIDGVPKHLVIKLNRAKFEQMTDSLVQRTLEPCFKALQDAYPDICLNALQDAFPREFLKGRSLAEQAKKAADLPSAKLTALKKELASKIDEIILVGGSTRIPRIQEEVEKFFGKKPNRSVNPDEVVAIGAAVQGGIMSGAFGGADILLLDVTPLSLGIETMGNIYDVVIEANTTVPTKKSKTYSTASDNQPQVEIHILQGERPMARDNRSVGRFVLNDIPPAPRGVPQIEVTFDMDANGILSVTAMDKGTGKQQNIRIEASTGLSKDEIARMKAEAQANAESDRETRERAEKLNAADSLIFQTEKQLHEFGEKVPANHRETIEKALEELREAHKAQDINRVDTAQAALTEAWNAASQEIYAAQQAAGGGGQTAENPYDSATGGPKGGDSGSEAQDVEFEEVKS